MALVALLATVKFLFGFNNKKPEEPEKSEKKTIDSKTLRASIKAFFVP